eukprot:3265497-Rhodomonas_salina.5
MAGADKPFQDLNPHMVKIFNRNYVSPLPCRVFALHFLALIGVWPLPGGMEEYTYRRMDGPNRRLHTPPGEEPPMPLLRHAQY